MPSPTSPTERGGAQYAPETHNGASETPTEAFGDAFERVGELKAYATHFVSAKVDALKLTGRNIAIYAALGLVGMFAGAAVVITAVVLALRGLAEAVAALLGGRQWAGNLIVGFALLLILGLGAWMGMNRVFGISRRKLKEKYESKRRQHQAEFGHDVHERARERERDEAQRA